MSALPQENVKSVHSHTLKGILHALNQQVQGSSQVVEYSLAALLAKGHVLLEGPPGVGKTSLAKAFARIFSGTVSRLQMTSDLLPSEITGVLRIQPKTQELEFRQGPLFANFVLADELNRCSPKTQSALLEAMAEQTITVDGVSHPLPQPFFVIATQNPHESHGVYSLADSQLDRFTVKLSLGFPSQPVQKDIFKSALKNIAPKNSEKFYDLNILTSLQEQVSTVEVEDSIINWLIQIIDTLRNHDLLASGISVRAGIQYLSFLQALALVRDRDYVIPSDVLNSAPFALAHRLSFKSGDSSQKNKELFVEEIIKSIKAPF